MKKKANWKYINEESVKIAVYDKKKLLGNCIKKNLKNKIYTSKVDTVKWFFPMIASSNIKVLLW